LCKHWPSHSLHSLWEDLQLAKKGGRSALEGDRGERNNTNERMKRDKGSRKKKNWRKGERHDLSTGYDTRQPDDVKNLTEEGGSEPADHRGNDWNKGQTENGEGDHERRKGRKGTGSKHGRKETDFKHVSVLVSRL